MEKHKKVHTGKTNKRRPTSLTHVFIVRVKFKATHKYSFMPSLNVIAEILSHARTNTHSLTQVNTHTHRDRFRHRQTHRQTDSHTP